MIGPGGGLAWPWGRRAAGRRPAARAGGARLAWFHLWGVPLVLGSGVLLNAGLTRQQSPSLREPLESAVPSRLAGLPGQDVKLSPEEATAVGMTSYLYRVHATPASAGAAGQAFSVYVGYFDNQTHGATIHSPKNCLPGSGWQALSSKTEAISVGGVPIRVNRYLIERRGERALVLYWYQGRGRVEASEYRVKWELLRDAVLLRRSEEAVVRVFVWLPKDESEALALSKRVAREVIPTLATALPPRGNV